MTDKPAGLAPLVLSDSDSQVLELRTKGSSTCFHVVCAERKMCRVVVVLMHDVPIRSGETSLIKPKYHKSNTR